MDLYADGAHVISKILLKLKGSDQKLMLSEHVTYQARKIVEMRVVVFDEPTAPLAAMLAKH